MRPSLPWLLVALPAAFLGCAEAPTQVVVRIATDLTAADGVDAIAVHVLDGAGVTVNDAPIVIEALSEDGSFVQVGTFGVTPAGGDATRRFEVRAEARFGGRVLFSTRARSGFVSRRTIVLDVYVAAQCLAIAQRCAADETCGVAGCTDPEIEAAGLGTRATSPLDGDDPRGAPALLGMGEACTTDAECAPGAPACVLTHWGGVRTACARPCTEHAECAPGICVNEIEGVTYCTIACDPVAPFTGCPEGTHCIDTSPSPEVLTPWATHCADWPLVSSGLYASCPGYRLSCADGLVCGFAFDELRCTQRCDAGPPERGCPDGSVCVADFAEATPDRTFGYCVPESGWPAG